MALINQPPTEPVDRQNADGGNIELNASWRNWVNSAFNILNALTTMSGATANRPTQFLWEGRAFLDTTLGYMINVKTTSPVVWIRWDGTPV